MKTKTIYEGGYIVKANVFDSSEIDTSSESATEDFFIEQNKNGYVFLKAYKEGSDKKCMFISKDDYKKYYA